MIQVKDLNHLKELATNANGDMQDFFISLAGGLARSSKRIIYDPANNTFDIFNEIDDSFEDDLTPEQLGTRTNILGALEGGTLFKY